MRGSVIVVAMVLGSISSAQADGNPHVGRLLNSFVTNCGLSNAEYEKKEEAPAFARKNYSGDWFRTTPTELKNCWECFEAAFVWNGREGRHVVQVERSSESGDWYQYILHCYGTDDKLARGLSDLNTAWGWAVVTRFEVRQGKVSEGPLEFRDTGSWRRITKMPDNPIGADEMYAGRKPVMYSTFQELPFYALLKEKR